jgi:hypothetical protein
MAYTSQAARKVSAIGVSEQIRTFDEDGFRRRAGCVCFSRDRARVSGAAADVPRRHATLLPPRCCGCVSRRRAHVAAL